MRTIDVLLLSAVLGLPCRSYAQANPVEQISKALGSRDFDAALRDSDANLKRTPNDKRIWVLRGMAYAGRGEPVAALSSYQHALTLDSSYLPALEGAAQIEYQRHSAAAKPLLLKVLEQSPNDPTSHAMLAFLEYSSGHCGEAVPHFAMSAEVLARQPMGLAAYGVCRAQARQYEQAIPLFQQALAAEPSMENIRFDLALAQWKAHQPQEALSSLQPAIEAGRASSEALVLAAGIYESIHDTPHAVDVLRKSILADPKNVNAYLDFAELSYDHDSMQVGIDVLHAGLSQLPNEARLYLARGIFYAQQGKFDEAGEDFERANRLDPKLTVLAAAEGLAASQQHKSEDALRKFRAAAKAQPNDALTQYLLAEALSQESSHAGSLDYAAEVAAAKRAYRLDPSMVAAHDLLATLYLREGNISAAIEESNAALAVDENDQQAIFHLVLALRKSGHKERIPGLLKQLAALRNTRQSEQALSMRYQLKEIPPEGEGTGDSGRR